MKKLTLALLIAFAACAVPTTSNAGFFDFITGIPIIGPIIGGGINLVGSILGGPSPATGAQSGNPQA